MDSPAKKTVSVNLPFLGQRDYIHSTSILQIAKKEFNLCSPYTLICKSEIETNTVIFSEHKIRDNEPAALVQFGINKEFQIFLYPSKSVKPFARIEYEENDGSKSTLNGTELNYARHGSDDLIQTVISLNKYLLQTIYNSASIADSWRLAKIEVTKEKSDWQTLTLQHIGRFAGKLFQTNIEVDGVTCGQLLFTCK